MFLYCTMWYIPRSGGRADIMFGLRDYGQNSNRVNRNWSKLMCLEQAKLSNDNVPKQSQYRATKIWHPNNGGLQKSWNFFRNIRKQIFSLKFCINYEAKMILMNQPDLKNWFIQACKKSSGLDMINSLSTDCLIVHFFRTNLQIIQICTVAVFVIVVFTA